MIQVKVYYVRSFGELSGPEIEAIQNKDGDLLDFGDSFTNYLFCRTEYEGLDIPYIRYVNCDGGEAEDQTLRRDYSWVAEELNRAYVEGTGLDVDQLYSMLKDFMTTANRLKEVYGL